MRTIRHIVDRHALFDRHGVRVLVVLADEETGSCWTPAKFSAS
jgi:hypothetical protein